MLRSRFAPTPSGYLHTGNAFSFLLTWLLMRKQGGEIVLRIDDIDADRKRPEYVQDIFDSIAWLGLDYDYGPKDVFDFEARWSQHRRLAEYAQFLQQLTPVLFACDCSRSMLPKQAAYPGTCTNKNLPLNTPDTAWRIRINKAIVLRVRDLIRGDIDVPLGEMIGNFVVRKKDKLPAYQITSVVDDVQYQINCLVRGEDLIASSAAQLYLAEATLQRGFMRARFYHHPLITDAAGNKLSKSEGAASLKTQREQGQGPEVIYRAFAQWLQLPVEGNSLSELLEAFDPGALRFR